TARAIALSSSRRTTDSAHPVYLLDYYHITERQEGVSMLAHGRRRVLETRYWRSPESTSSRPAVCLTEPIGPHRHVIVAFITSRPLTDVLETAIVLEVNRPDFAATGLHVSSTLRMHRLMTISTALIRRTLG